MEGVMVCLDGAVLGSQGFLVKPEAVSKQPGELDCHTGDCSDGRSHVSCSTDASLAGRLSDTAEQPLNKTHHLLRHCLNSGQRQEALAHFSSQDVKEAAKEISRMGQRELQGKFKLVYGNTTHSNNNDWLRRKLFEAIGAAPLKANSKGKSRKPASKPKSKAHSAEPVCRGSPAAVAIYGAHPGAAMPQPLMVPTTATSVRCSPKAFKGPTSCLPVPVAATPKLHQQLQQNRMAGAPRRTFPASPLLTGSVLDMHRYESALSRDTSDSEESWEAGSGEEEETRNNHGSSSNSPYVSCLLPSLPTAVATECVGGMGALLMPKSSLLPTQQQQAQQQHVASANMEAPTLGLDTLDLGLADNNNDWLRDTWGDACDVLGAFTLGSDAQPPTLLPPDICSPASSLDDDDVMLLPLDLSAIDTFAFA